MVWFTQQETQSRVPTGKEEFERRLAQLRSGLVSQGKAVQQAIELAVDAAFEKDATKGRRCIEADHAIDRVDIEIERAAAQLLADATATGAGAVLSPGEVRTVLMIVKINNEYERIADCAVNIGEKTQELAGDGAPLPSRFRVMANSVIGIMQTTNSAFASMDIALAERVLASDDTTEAFKHALLHETLERLSKGMHSSAQALALQMVVANLGRMADHCTNVAEQVIYAMSGKTVRHEGERWTKPEEVR